MPPSRSRSPAPRAEPSRRRSRSPRRRSPRREGSYRDKDRDDRDRPRSPRLRSPRRDDSNRDRDRRDRSRDREERPRERKPKSSGFKWKERRREDEREEPKRLERGYRNRSPSPRRSALKAESKAGKGLSVEDKFGVSAKFGSSVAEKFGASAEEKFGPSKKDDADTSKPPQRAAAAASTGAPSAQAPTNEPMIIVHVNDRLGTKAAIPCLASDPVRLFKAQVAARIGRQPHEILLKRQGERPFKDQLTLEDYGVSNGVQLDLEIDTGD